MTLAYRLSRQKPGKEEHKDPKSQNNLPQRGKYRKSPQSSSCRQFPQDDRPNAATCGTNVHQKGRDIRLMRKERTRSWRKHSNDRKDKRRQQMFTAMMETSECSMHLQQKKKWREGVK
ncbi:unnamed protein product [Eretmochelys imbricata]